MIPVLPAEKTSELDEATIESEPILSVDLMERAAKNFVSKYCKYYSKKNPVAVFCGQGNNGGDGLAIARLLHKEDFIVEVFVLVQKKSSADFDTNHFRIQQIKKLFPHYINTKSDFPEAIFSTNSSLLSMSPPE